MPDGAITGALDLAAGKLLVRRFQLLQQTTSGFASLSHRSSTSRRPLMPLTL